MKEFTVPQEKKKEINEEQLFFGFIDTPTRLVINRVEEIRSTSEELWDRFRHLRPHHKRDIVEVAELLMKQKTEHPYSSIVLHIQDGYLVHTKTINKERGKGYEKMTVTEEKVHWMR